MVGHRISAAALAVLLTASAAAQDARYDPLKRNMEAFVTLLEQALELERNRGLFGLGGERIDSMYLAGHGLVLELRSELANVRSRLELTGLNNSVAALRRGDNPFALLAREARAASAASPEETAAGQLSNAEDEPNRQVAMLLQASEVDLSDVVNAAIAQAGEYARILREADGVDDSAFARLREEIDTLRREQQLGGERLRELGEAMRDGAREQREQLQPMLDELTGDMDQLRRRAEEMAAELRAQSETAQAERAARWRADVADLEANLGEAMCVWGASLAELPADENVTVILNGLGEESAGGGRADLIRTFSKADLLLCAGGEISRETLDERSNRYSF